MYSNNLEYRKVLRSYFKMDTKSLEIKYSHLKDNNSESYDELIYDEDAMKYGIKTIYDSTQNNIQFCELYKKAAGQFLTEDLEIGICVLLTYDYLSFFIPLYENPQNKELYKILYNKL